MNLTEKHQIYINTINNMNKKDFLDSYNRYGIKEKDICMSRIGVNGDDVEEIAVIAPLHKAEWYKGLGAEVVQQSHGYYPIYRITYNGVSFSFISTQIGAPNADEIVVALAFSNCKKIIFTGSCGAIKNCHNIGDILIPNYSMCGDGATMYYTKNLVGENHVFGKRFYPTKSLNNKLITYLKNQNINFKFVNNFSIDTIVGQFLHIEEFLSYGAEVIEMETSSVFCLAEMLSIEAVAILNVSDSTVAKKSLLAGRSHDELKKHFYTEEELVPKLVLGFIQKIEEENQ